MSTPWRITAVLAATLALASCGDDLPTTGVDPVPAPPRGAALGRAQMESMAQAATPGDPAIGMRRELRAMDDATFLKEMERTGNIVMVGFKIEGTQRGVSARGEALVPADEKGKRMQTVERMAKRVIHKFQGIPAIGVEMPSAQAALQLRNLPWVDYVAPGGSGQVTPDVATATMSTVSCYNNYAYAPQPTSPQLLPWNITRIRADQAWGVAGRGDGNIAVLDDGMDEGPANLNPVELPWNFKRYYAPSTSVNGQHGTPVAGAAFARDNGVGTVGVAPYATGRIYKVYDPGDQNWELYSAWSIDDARYHAKVITLSYSTKQTSSTAPSAQAGLLDAIRNAYYQNSVLITASTGNQERADLYAYPAKFDEVIGVGGSGYSDQWVYNNYAPGNVEVAAPAVDVSTVCKGGGIGIESGTSFATPMVAGALMVMRQKFPYHSNDQIRAKLRSTAVPMASTQKSGAGRIDLLAAVGPDPLSVSISGPTYISTTGSYTWTANPVNGDGTYTYNWEYSNDGFYWYSVSTGSTYSGYFSVGDPDFQLRVTVTSAGQTAQGQTWVDVASAPCPPPQLICEPD